jgi:hypothetical protein
VFLSKYLITLNTNIVFFSLMCVFHR